jgi:organic hydroperoxide reductase OsmC/OhrA
MSAHTATIRWQNDSTGMDYDRYNRNHTWEIAGNIVPASAAPEFKGSAGRVDPEAALVASLSACHMLTFLAIAARKRLVVASYTDQATGWLEKNAAGQLAITRVELRPDVRFAAGAAVSAQDLARLHERAHHECFIANSVKTEVTVKPGSEP